MENRSTILVLSSAGRGGGQVSPDGQSMEEVPTLEVVLEQNLCYRQADTGSLSEPLKLKLISPMRIRPSKFCTSPWGGVAL